MLSILHLGFVLVTTPKPRYWEHVVVDLPDQVSWLLGVDVCSAGFIQLPSGSISRLVATQICLEFSPLLTWGEDFFQFDDMIFFRWVG